MKERSIVAPEHAANLSTGYPMPAVDRNPYTRPLAEGVTLSKIRPGGKDGPNGEVHEEVPGGRHWSERWTLGYPSDAIRLVIPDIRLPPNQIWPIHWHDCWIAGVILDGICLIGDWWMKPGDLLISAASLEYGPVVAGPSGCQLLEIFANEDLAPGGYAPEYRDHPTISRPGFNFNFLPRPPGSERNQGRQTLPIDGVKGLTKGTLKGGQRWDLGEPADPNRGVVLDTKLKAGENYPPHWHRDWRAVIVWSGSMKVGGTETAKNDLLVLEPNSEVGAFEPGPQGVHLLEFARTATALPAVYREEYRQDSRYREVLKRAAATEFAAAPPVRRSR